MKLLSPRIHAPLDYVLVLLYALAPSLFALGETAATISYVYAGAYLALSLLTRYPLGVVKVIPFPVHGAIELASGIFLVAAPWLLGFADAMVPRNFFVAMGIATVIVWAVTDYKAAEQFPEQRVGGVRPTGPRPA